MKRRIGTGILLCTAALTLTACGKAKETDLSARYPDIFRYCFGEDAKLQYSDTTDYGDYHADRWRYIYHDVNGGEREYEQLINRYSERSDLAAFQTEDEYYRNALLNTLQIELWNVCSETICTELLEPVFGETAFADSEISSLDISTEDYTVSVYPMWGLGDQLSSTEFAGTQLEPGKGFRVCTADLQTLAQDARFMLCMDATLTGADADTVTAYMQAFEESYLAQTGSPQNYSLVLRQTGADGLPEVLYESSRLLGEATNASTVTWLDYQQKLIETYQQTGTAG